MNLNCRLIRSMFFLAKAVVHFNKNGQGIRSRIGLVYLKKIGCPIFLPSFSQRD